MSEITFTETYYLNKVVIVIESVQEMYRQVNKVPDAIKEHIFYGLSENQSEGQFTHKDCRETISRELNLYQTYQGHWKVVSNDYEKMLAIAKWSANRNSEEIFTEEMFVNHFGKSYGKHYFMKWQGELEFNYAKAYGYFRTRRDHGQIFCDMMMQLVNKYLKREPL